MGEEDWVLQVASHCYSHQVAHFIAAIPGTFKKKNMYDLALWSRGVRQSAMLCCDECQSLWGEITG